MRMDEGNKATSKNLILTSPLRVKRQPEPSAAANTQE